LGKRRKLHPRACKQTLKFFLGAFLVPDGHSEHFDCENPAELDALKADLHAEHQPTNTTEDILVNEMAEQYWRISEAAA
jgi:hypothetical protein